MAGVSEDFIGTCQACLGEFKVSADGKMVLHGYTRPGDGFTHGQCLGAYEAPYEYDRALTGRIAADFHIRVAACRDWLNAAATGKVVNLIWKRRVDGPYLRTLQRDFGFLEVELKSTIYPDHEQFENVLAREIVITENQLRLNQLYAAEFDKRYAEWTKKEIIGLDVPPTGRERYLRLPYDPDRIAAEEATAAKKAERNAKPGKLKIVFFFADPERQAAIQHPSGTDEEFNARLKAFEKCDGEFEAKMKDVIRPWAKKTFSAAKGPRVSEGSDFDMPRKSCTNVQHRVIIMNIDWSYLDQITTLFPTATKETDGPKKVTFFVNASPV